MSINSKYKVAKTMFLIVRAIIRNFVNYEYPKLAHQYFKDKTFSMQIKGTFSFNSHLAPKLYAVIFKWYRKRSLFHVSFFFLW